MKDRTISSRSPDKWMVIIRILLCFQAYHGRAGFVEAGADKVSGTRFRAHWSKETFFGFRHFFWFPNTFFWEGKRDVTE